MNVFTVNSNLKLGGGEGGGARVSEFFLQSKSKKKKIFFWGGGGGGGGGGVDWQTDEQAQTNLLLQLLQSLGA